MRPKIYHKHPRNFANECLMVRATTKAECDYAEAHDYKYLTQEDARSHLQFVNAENDAWGSNRAFGRLTVSDLPTIAQYWEGHFGC